MTVTRLAAHRGGGALWPENSLLAFRSALALGVDLLEFDVHRTADGAVAVIHDATLDRTTTGEGVVAEHSVAALRRLRLRGPNGAVTDEPLPLLDDVLALVAPGVAGLLVEVKGAYPGLPDQVVTALGEAALLDRATIMAFNPDVLLRIRELSPTLRTTLLIAGLQVERAEAPVEAVVGWATALAASELGIEHTLVTPSLLARARAAGLGLGVWTVNEEATMERMLALGVDVITTDRPDLGVRLLGRS